MSFALAYGYFVKLHGSHPHKEWGYDFEKGNSILPKKLISPSPLRTVCGDP